MPDHLAEHFHSYWNFHKLSSQLTIQGFVPEKENGLNGSQNHMVKKRENGWAQNNTEVMVLARLHGCQGIINSFSFTSLLSASLEELRVLASMLKRLGQHLFFGV